MRYLFLLLAFIGITFSGCSSAAKRKQEVQRQVLYSVIDSVKKSRYDLAEKYANEAARVIPPPKKRIVINEFKLDNPKFAPESGLKLKTDTNLVVLPEKESGKKVIVRESAEYKKAVSENKTLAKTELSNDKTIEKLGTQVDKVLRDNETELLKEKKKSWWGWLIGGFSIGTIILVVVLVAVFPAALPLVMNIFGCLVGLVNKLIKVISDLFKGSG